MFSDLMTQEGHSYDFVYDWLMKKSERATLRGAIKADEEEVKDTKKMTKAEKFRSTQQDYKKKEPASGMEERKIAKETSAYKPELSKPKETAKGSKRRKTYNLKGSEKEESKKPDIYSAMKDAGFGSAKPKIVTNNVRSYRY